MLSEPPLKEQSCLFGSQHPCKTICLSHVHCLCLNPCCQTLIAPDVWFLHKIPVWCSLLRDQLFGFLQFYVLGFYETTIFPDQQTGLVECAHFCWFARIKSREPVWATHRGFICPLLGFMDYGISLLIFSLKKGDFISNFLHIRI